jgi:hypothetical protein
VPLFVQMLLFLSPVFYPVSAVPPGLTFLYNANPLGAVIEAARAAVLRTAGAVGRLVRRTGTGLRRCHPRPRLLPAQPRRVRRCPLTKSSFRQAA